jgi:hypothetical protein
MGKGMNFYLMQSNSSFDEGEYRDAFNLKEQGFEPNTQKCASFTL